MIVREALVKKYGTLGTVSLITASLIDSYRKMYRGKVTQIMNDNAVHRERSVDKEEISIHLDSELLDQINHLTNDPSKVIETAIRQWLRGERERDDELTRTLERNPPVPLRGEWND
jgi:recombinational DNA repair ATPase RecF